MVVMDDTKIENTQISQQEVIESLLWPLWRCVDDSYKERYKREVWEHFENALKSASYTARLSTFLTNFQKRIPADLQAQYMQQMVIVLNAPNQKEILNWLRDDTSYMCAILRLKNQERREAFKETKLPKQLSFDETSLTGQEFTDQSSELDNWMADEQSGINN